jgi:hypothetical protein
MNIIHSIYEYPDHINLNLDIQEISLDKMNDLVKSLKSIGITIPYRTFTEFPGLSEIIEESLKRGMIEVSNDGISRCKKCGCGGTYSIYKSGPNKGNPNYNKEKRYPSGIKFNMGFISFKNSGDYCQDCLIKYDIINVVVQKILDLNLPIEIKVHAHDLDKKTKFVRDNERKCFSCEKTMYESEMNREHRIMDSSTYPAECPHCQATSLAFGKIHGSTGKFRMLTIEEYTHIMKDRKIRHYNTESKSASYSDVMWKNGRVY